MSDDRIQALLAAKRELEQIQRHCNHRWGQWRYTPYQGYGLELTGGLEKRGSDVWPETRLVPKMVAQWTMTCEICGLEKHRDSRP